MRGVAVQFTPDRRAHVRARTIASDNVPGSNHLGFAGVDPGVFQVTDTG